MNPDVIPYEMSLDVRSAVSEKKKIPQRSGKPRYSDTLLCRYPKCSDAPLFQIILYEMIARSRFKKKKKKKNALNAKESQSTYLIICIQRFSEINSENRCINYL